MPPKKDVAPWLVITIAFVAMQLIRAELVNLQNGLVSQNGEVKVASFRAVKLSPDMGRQRISGAALSVQKTGQSQLRYCGIFECTRL